MNRLPHTWDALLARFGRFTSIQEQAIDPLLGGKNCVLVSATASGKTEAALAPLLELDKRRSFARIHTRSLRLLYIVPTRALTRDLARRLEQPLARLAVRMKVKTGDEPPLNRSPAPELLLTTPESFDSMLANAPRMLKDVRFVVLDEIHLYDNTPRGDQLRVLLNRLRRLKSYALARGDVASDAVQFCALSATVSDPKTVAGRYFADPVVVQTNGQRELDVELLAMDGPGVLRQLFADLPRRGGKKVLVFCQRRAECEELAHLFSDDSPFGDQVYVHHASLDRRVRHAVEREFSNARAALCFATATLELGIDIGDVDLIVLTSPPNSTGSFLQRIGRGNRRTSRTAVVCLYRTAREEALYRIFIRAAVAGEIEAEDYVFRPSVIIQQLCSYIKQTRFGEFDPESAYELFAAPDGTPLLGKSQYESIIEYLIRENFFLSSGSSALRPGVKWQELYERRAIYSNLKIAGGNTVDVIDEVTGRRLGEIERGAAMAGVPFLLGGQTRRAATAQGPKRERKLIVQSIPQSAASAPRFRTPWRPLSRQLAQALAAQLGYPRKAGEIGVFIEETPQHEIEQSQILHCAGETYGLIFGDLLESLYGIKVEECNEILLMVEGILPVNHFEFNPEQVDAHVRRRWRQFEGWLEQGSFQSYLPPDVRRATVVDAFNIAEFLRTFSGLEVKHLR